MTYELWLGDCLKEMDRIESGSVDAIIADLPYGTTACKWDVIIPFEPLWAQYKRVIKRNGAVVLFGREPFTSILVYSALEIFKYKWVWDKVKPGNHTNAKLMPLSIDEDICIFSLGGASNGAILPMRYNPQMILRNKPVRVSLNQALTNRNQKNPKYSNSLRGFYEKTYTHRYPKSILSFSNANQGEKLHPTQKPVTLLSYLIKTYSNEGDLILDNVMGSGSTGEACLRTNRKFIGIEKDPKYFEVAQNRLQKVALELSGEFIEKKPEESHPQNSEWLF